MWGMSDSSWTDQIAAERMRVDQRFEEKVQASSFSRQQWGLVMTAVEFEIDGPEDPETATLRADTSSLSSVMSEVEKADQRGGAMGASGGGSSNSGGLLSSLSSALGIGGGGADSELLAEAEDLTQDYARQLQNRLEDRKRWQSVCAQAAEE
jgi:hypothetical protein